MADPIQVLRDATYAAASTNAGPSDISTADYAVLVDEALTQVEALVEAARNVTFAIWEGSDTEEAAAEAFKAALAPFKDTT